MMKELTLKEVIEELADGNSITVKELNGDIMVFEYGADDKVKDFQVFKNRYLKGLMKNDKRRDEPEVD